MIISENEAKPLRGEGRTCPSENPQHWEVAKHQEASLRGEGCTCPPENLQHWEVANHQNILPAWHPKRV